jgi:hypothetical protein
MQSITLSNPLLRRNRYLSHVNVMLETTTSSTLHHEAAIAPPSIPPPGSLWSTVLSKVGHGPQGASPVYTILCDRLATWIPP